VTSHRTHLSWQQGGGLRRVQADREPIPRPRI
jgi:hypothetical protein